jgi:hypothetical protein
VRELMELTERQHRDILQHMRKERELLRQDAMHHVRPLCVLHWMKRDRRSHAQVECLLEWANPKP